MRSIRRQLLRSIAGSALLLIVVGAALLLLFLRAWFTAQLDRDLLARARGLAGYVDREVTSYEFEIASLQLPEYQRADSGEYFQVWLADGQSLGKSASLSRAELPPPQLGPGQHRSWNGQLPGGRPGRLLALGLLPKLNEPRPAGFTEQQLTIVAARETSELTSVLQGLALGMAAFSLAFMLALGLMLPRLLKRGLGPLDELARQLDLVESSSLSQRFTLAQVPAELQPVYQHINLMLERVEAAFGREKRLTADMAHELKTPLAELRALAELALRWPDDPECRQQGFQDVWAISLQMEGLVNALLLLARTQSQEQAVRAEDLDLALLLSRLWQSAQPLAVARRLDVRVELPTNLPVRSDPALLSSILQNLLDNAFKHCPSGGQVRCELSAHDGRPLIRLSNTNDQLSVEDLESIFEPLWRKEAARSQSEHAGLGLTIARALAAALHGELSAALGHEREFIITLSLPFAVA